jgi:hypothetical protein
MTPLAPPSWWQPIIPSVVGGMLTGSVALLGIWLTYKNNLRLNARQKQSRINGILHAMRYELQVVNELYNEGHGGNLEALKEGEAFTRIVEVSDNYLCIYPNNTEIVGQIDDKDLCRAIIATHHKASALNDRFKINNFALMHLKEVCTPAAYMDPAKPQLIKEELIKMAVTLKRAHSDLNQESVNLIRKIDEYLLAHGGASKTASVLPATSKNSKTLITEVTPANQPAAAQRQRIAEA